MKLFNYMREINQLYAENERIRIEIKQLSELNKQLTEEFEQIDKEIKQLQESNTIYKKITPQKDESPMIVVSSLGFILLLILLFGAMWLVIQ